MTHILITDLRDIRYMAYVPEEPKLRCASPEKCNDRLCWEGRFKPYCNHIWLYDQALEKAKRESVPFDQPFDVTYIIDKLHYQACEKADTYIESKTPEPGIYQVPVEVEVVEMCGHDSCPVDAGCEHCKEPVKVARLKSSEPKEESQDELWQSNNPNAERYIMTTNIHTDGMPKSWLELWSEVEQWYGDISKRETGEQFLKRMQSKYSLQGKEVNQ